MARATQAPDRAWRTDLERIVVPVARPSLPSVEELTPYLKRIDAARWYSNGGALVREFEKRLAERMNVGEQHVALVSNATVGLALALAALDLPAQTLCMMPAWTFAASAHAAILAGLIPWFVDVEEASWSLTPAAARSQLREAPGKVSAVMPVAPFGNPVDGDAWEAFDAQKDCAVVLDAAAAFDTARASRFATVVSLHATKILGVGEGAFVACRDAGLIDSIRRRSNFGFWGEREATVEATNAKLSEYAAAVGLAGLDRWDQTRSDFQRVAGDYKKALAGIPGVALQPGYGLDFVSTTTNVVVPPGTIEALEDALANAGFGTRRWWGDGLVAQRAFRDCPRAATPITQRLGATILGLPCWADLPTGDIGRIGKIVARVCGPGQGT
jgi:dTDP-4-amino-4,6-dideoxygalactose transaminase